ncbi:GxxExxY protein [Chryseobacterium taiwanense]|uniref:GxxExxY protein n=1 Tax=Chryseobacterium taiwanense TaxID=363331 RepID=A0A0B4DKB0_9FLAO|nr:GxxExxY protein [Chryseobacterium taiwanense]KIC64845.1 GxxExxY protein [Chryseobacterium taiwanense]
MTENEISKIIFEAGLKIHRKLGAGLYERVYEECLAYELKNAGLNFERQKTLPIQYESLFVNDAFRVDLLVEGKVIVELKASTEKENMFFEAQLLNYLRLGNYKLGMLLNFHLPLFKNGVRRIVNGL